MRRRAAGPTAWLMDDVDDPAMWAASVRERRIEGVREIVPAERTVLVSCAREVTNAVGETLDAVAFVPAKIVRHPATVTIDVVYDGADLSSVAESTGLTTDEVIERHANGTYAVAFCGFSPGFAYMTGLDPALQLDRRATPRTRVPGGSVAIAAAYTSVYPSPSPGGWHLLGSTDAVLWNADRPDPALLVPGSVVRFRQVKR